ncbi:type II toxin-antitoxin system RelE/ParE family toxin [Zobellella denitrificans]
MKVEFTELAQQTLISQKAYLVSTGARSPGNASEHLKELVKHIIEQLGAFPELGPASRQLLELGVARYREYLHKGYRIFYEYDPAGSTVTVHAILRQNQDVQLQLFELLILRP